MKAMAFLTALLGSLGLAFVLSGTAHTTSMQDRNAPPSKEIKPAKTGWALPAGHKTEWAIFGSG